ncbi:MAG: DUF58 domain-containing protein [Rubripirellula sp.]
MSNSSEPRRRHRLTRLGFHFLFVGAFAMLGGALRGFNLLLVLAGLLVGALIMQWRWSRRTVEAINIKRRLPGEAFAGTSFRVRYRLLNQSRFIPVWMIRVEDVISSIDQTDSATALCGVGVISPRQTVVPYYDCVIGKRGKYHFGPLSLMTTFPFALFNSRQTTSEQSEFFVFPELLTLKDRWQQRLISRNDGVATTARRSGPSEGEFFGLREWQTGDSPKWIHWRTTARLNEPAVRQFEQQRRFDLCLLVDAFQVSDEDEDNVELAISLAATILVKLANSPSNRVVVSVAGIEADAVIGGGSGEGKRRMLKTLAEVVATEQPDLSEAARRALAVVGQTQDLIVISPRSLKEAKQRDPDFSDTIAPWMRRGSFKWIDVGRQIDQWTIRETVLALRPDSLAADDLTLVSERT